MQELEQTHVRAEAQRESLRAELLKEQSKVKAAKGRLLKLKQAREAQSDLKRQLLTAKKSAKRLETQLKAEQVRSCNLSGAARQAGDRHATTWACSASCWAQCSTPMGLSSSSGQVEASQCREQM